MEKLNEGRALECGCVFRWVNGMLRKVKGCEKHGQADTKFLADLELLEAAVEYYEWNEAEYHRHPRISERLKAAIRAAGGVVR